MNVFHFFKSFSQNYLHRLYLAKSAKSLNIEEESEVYTVIQDAEQVMKDRRDGDPGISWINSIIDKVMIKTRKLMQVRDWKQIDIRLDKAMKIVEAIGNIVGEFYEKEKVVRRIEEQTKPNEVNLRLIEDELEEEKKVEDEKIKEITIQEIKHIRESIGEKESIIENGKALLSTRSQLFLDIIKNFKLPFIQICKVGVFKEEKFDDKSLIHIFKKCLSDSVHTLSLESSK